MSVTKIGNIDLDDNLRLYGLESADDITVSQYVAFDGSVDILTMPPPASRSLQLVGNRNGNAVRGRFSLEQISGLKALAQTGQAQELVHHRGTFSVLILSVAEVTPILDKSDPQSTDWYTATVNMIEV